MVLARGRQVEFGVNGFLDTKGEKVASKEPPLEEGWRQLFNNKDLNGWYVPRPGHGAWTVNKDGHLVGKGTPRSHIFTQRDDFTDFHLRTEFKAAGGSAGGVFLRCGPNRLALQLPAGYWITIGDSRQMGALYLTSPERKDAELLAKATPVPLTADSWNKMEIIARGNDIRVIVNDKLVAQHTDMKQTYKRGQIGLEAYAPDSVITFATVEIKELSAAERFVPEAGWVQFFNGKDDTGWAFNNADGVWKAENGHFVGTAAKNAAFYTYTKHKDYENYHPRVFNGKDLSGWTPDTAKRWLAYDTGGTINDRPHILLKGELPVGEAPDHLKSERDFGDFHLRARVKLAGAMEGHAIYFRVSTPGAWNGYGVLFSEERITIRYTRDNNRKHSAYVKNKWIKPNEYFDLEIIARGPHIRVLIDGGEHLSYTDPEAKLSNARGRVIVQLREGSLIFSKLEIKELLPSSKP